MEIRSPWHGKLDVPVRLACGCKVKWHEGETLYRGVYAWCAKHQDTTVEEVLAAPEVFAAETSDGVRYEMAARPREVGPTLIYTVAARRETDPVETTHFYLFLHPDHACLVEDNEALDSSRVLEPQDTALYYADPEAVFRFILGCAGEKDK